MKTASEAAVEIAEQCVLRERLTAAPGIGPSNWPRPMLTVGALTEACRTELGARKAAVAASVATNIVDCEIGGASGGVSDA